ncbi:MAG: phosphoglycerate transport [Bacteroidota bacterium]
MMNSTKLFSVLLSLFGYLGLFGVCFAQVPRIDVGESNALKDVKNHVLYFIDKTAKLEIEQIKAIEGFEPVISDIPNFGITESAIWLKFQLYNSGLRDDYLLQIAQPGLDEVALYIIDSIGEMKSFHTGEYLPFSLREYHDPNYIFKIRIQPHHLINVFVRVKARDNVQIPISIGSPEKVFETNKARDTLVGFYVGIMIVMLTYNLFIYYTVRDQSYLFYILYLAAVILTQASILGYTFQYLWPGSPAIASFSSFIFPPIAGTASLLFMRSLLQTRRLIPESDHFWIVFPLIYIIAIFLALLGNFPVSFQLIEACAMLLSIYMLAEAMVLFRRGSRPAIFFLIAWSIFLVGVAVYVMKDFGILPYNNFTLYTMPAGSAMEVVLLSFALADRIKLLKVENERVQAEKISALRENERLVNEQNVMLERKVQERTLQLERANSDLNYILNNLKEAQAQLVDSEKMASLGQLTAGIAHEINNPINFVSANISPLKRDLSELIQLLSLYHKLNPDHDIREQIAAINKFKQEINLSYLISEIDTLFKGIEEGAARTAEIVKSLKNFSRLDESDIKDVDLNEGIKSTLILLRHTFPDNLRVETRLTELGLIECYPGKLNQVFMNIIDNAIYAMSQIYREQHLLLIETTLENNQPIVHISDSGAGMSAEVKSRIFEPFFTTKEIGKGTGLGMSIVFKIIESHNAKIELHSIPGEGTHIILRMRRKLSNSKENYRP